MVQAKVCPGSGGRRVWSHCVQKVDMKEMSASDWGYLSTLFWFWRTKWDNNIIQGGSYPSAILCGATLTDIPESGLHQHLIRAGISVSLLLSKQAGWP